ncbi:MAG: PAS domain S-box protein, partial [Cyanobacteria bacterium P01_G01_bin.54]
ATQISQGPRKDIEFYRTIIHALPDLIWLKDIDGIYLACNQRFEDFVGSSEHEILGKTDYDFVNTSLADSSRERDQEVLLKGYPSINEEWTTFADDEHRELLEIIRLPMHDDNRRLIGILGIGHNVTARRKSEEKLKQSQHTPGKAGGLMNRTASKAGVLAGSALPLPEITPA